MARPPLAMGTYGSVKVTKNEAGRWAARCRFRDYDGVTRHLKFVRRSKTAAQTALQDAINARQGAPAAPLRPHHTFERASELWLIKLDAQVAEGTRAATTADTYRQRLRAVILPAIGQWRLHECTVPLVDMFFRGLVTTQGAESRKTVRTVVSQVLRLAVQHEALRDNPTRHLDPIERGPRVPRALTAEERKQLPRLDGWDVRGSEGGEGAGGCAPARSPRLRDFHDRHGCADRRGPWRSLVRRRPRRRPGRRRRRSCERCRSSRSRATSCATVATGCTVTPGRPPSHSASSRCRGSSSTCCAGARCTATTSRCSRPPAASVRD